jgi:regulator of chromosome condensation
VLGRKSNTRNSIQCSLQPEAIGVKNVIDVFTGGYHSFVKVEKKIKQESQLAYYAWGLNNYGQLGIGSTGDSLVPTEIVSFRGHDIVDIVGGEHHSVALHANGSVYTFGRNDDG